MANSGSGGGTRRPSPGKMAEAILTRKYGSDFPQLEKILGPHPMRADFSSDFAQTAQRMSARREMRAKKG